MRRSIMAVVPQYIDVFLVCALAGELSFLAALFIKGPVVMQWIAMEYNSNGVMLDYFRHIIFAHDLKTVYSYDSACFPPLSYLFYHLLYRITCDGNIGMKIAELPGGVWQVITELPDEPWQMIVYMMYTIVGALLVCFAVERFLEKEPLWKRRLVFVAILFSLPMGMGAIERGNAALYVLALLLFSHLWKTSGNWVKREISLVLIAIAAGFKIYPAVFGGGYIAERKWKEAIRLLVYGVIFFMLPFALTGGLDSVWQYCSLLRGMMGDGYFGRVQFFRGLLNTAGITGVLAGVLNGVFAVVLIAGILFSQSEFRRWFFAAAFMALVPGGAYRYTAIYFVLPLMVLLSGTKNAMGSKEGYFASIMFALIFTVFTPLGFLQNFKIDAALPYTFTVPEAGMYAVIWMFAFAEIAMEFLSWRLRLMGTRGKRAADEMGSRQLER